jgi:hypothetical protein
MPWLLVVALVGAVGYGLGSSNRPAEPIRAVPQPAAQAEEQTMAPQALAPADMGSGAVSDETVRGVVKEHQDVAQYTYLRLATDKGETWAAVYRAPVKDGATVTVLHASSIHAFHSKELNRDFDTIWFGMLPGYETAPSLSAAPAAAAVDAGKLAPMKPAAGVVAIGDLAAKAKDIEGQQVTVAGHVVKENDGILGKNWIHLQDGTGSAADKSNDLLVTTDATAKVGDVVQATGTVRVKQDFGAGYAYDFVLERATITPAH